MLENWQSNAVAFLTFFLFAIAWGTEGAVWLSEKRITSITMSATHSVHAWNLFGCFSSDLHKANFLSEHWKVVWGLKSCSKRSHGGSCILYSIMDRYRTKGVWDKTKSSLDSLCRFTSLALLVTDTKKEKKNMATRVFRSFNHGHGRRSEGYPQIDNVKYSRL